MIEEGVYVDEGDSAGDNYALLCLNKDNKKVTVILPVYSNAQYVPIINRRMFVMLDHKNITLYFKKDNPGGESIDRIDSLKLIDIITALFATPNADVVRSLNDTYKDHADLIKYVNESASDELKLELNVVENLEQSDSSTIIASITISDTHVNYTFEIAFTTLRNTLYATKISSKKF